MCHFFSLIAASRGNTPPEADSRMSDQLDDEYEQGGPSQQVRAFLHFFYVHIKG